MKLIDADTVHRLLDYPSLVEALRQAHRREAAPSIVRTVLGEPGDGVNTFLALISTLYKSGSVGERGQTLVG